MRKREPKKPEKRFTAESRLFNARFVMPYLTDLGELLPDGDLPAPPLRTSDDPLDHCLQDYFHIPIEGYLRSICDYEHRAIVLRITTPDKSKQLVVVPRQGLGVAPVVGGTIPDGAEIAPIENAEACELFDLYSQEIADEIDRSIYAISIKIQNRFKDKNPNHNYRILGGDRFMPLPEEKKDDDKKD